jgi:hypothetical protein
MLARTKKTMETTRTSGLRSSMMKRGHLGKCEKSMAGEGMERTGERRRRGRVELQSQDWRREKEEKIWGSSRD